MIHGSSKSTPKLRAFAKYMGSKVRTDAAKPKGKK